MASASLVAAGPSRGFSILDNISVESSALSGPPPSYTRHQDDELLSPATVVHDRRRVSGHPLASTRTASLSRLLEMLTAPGELRMTLESGLVFPPPPSNALYHLPRALTWSGNEIFLFRSLPVTIRNRDSQPPRDLALYTMRRTPLTHEIVLRPRREGLKAAVMRGRRSLMGGWVWEVHVKNEIILCYAKGRWKNAAGDLLAEEPIPTGQNVVLTLVGQDLELHMKDLIVVSWLSRLWHETNRLGLAKSLLPNENALARRRPSNLVRWRAFRDA